MKASKTLYRGGAALTLATRVLELTVTTSVGPRVVSLKSLAGDAGNLFLELPRNDPRLHGYQLRGGHRLWRAPEDVVDSYHPDDDPVGVTGLPAGVALRQPVEKETGLQKAISIEFPADRTVRVVHTLTNLGRKPALCAPWPVTMLRRGGYGVIPLLPLRNQSGDNLVPRYSLVPWAYTDLSLPVWDLHSRFIGVDVARAKGAQKLGLTDFPGWSAYWNGGAVFVKFARAVDGAQHPDRGCRFETYTNGKMIELETLGALVNLAPGKSVAHTEYWTVLEGLPRPDTDKAFAKILEPAVRAWLTTL
jgi:hypothetical protein